MKKLKSKVYGYFTALFVFCGICVCVMQNTANAAQDYDTAKNLLTGAQIVRKNAATPNVDGETVKCGMLISPGSSTETTAANAVIIDGSLTNTSNYHTISKSEGNKASFRIKFSDEKNVKQVVITTRKQSDGTGLLDDTVLPSFGYSLQNDSWWSGSFTSVQVTVSSYTYTAGSEFKRTVIDLQQACKGKDFLLEIPRETSMNINEIEVYEDENIGGPLPICTIDDTSEPSVNGRNYKELSASAEMNSLVNIPVKKVEFFDKDGSFIGEGIKNENDGKYHFTWKNLEFETVYFVKAIATDMSGAASESSEIEFELQPLPESELAEAIRAFDTIADTTEVSQTLERYSEILENIGYNIEEHNALNPEKKTYFENAVVNFNTNGVYTAAEFYRFTNALKTSNNMADLAFCEDDNILEILKANKAFYAVDTDDKYFFSFDENEQKTVLSGLKQFLLDIPTLVPDGLNVKFKEICALQSFGSTYWGEYYDWIKHFNICLMIDLSDYENTLTEAEQVKVMQEMAHFKNAVSAEMIKAEFERLVQNAIDSRTDENPTPIVDVKKPSGGGGAKSPTTVKIVSDNSREIENKNDVPSEGDEGGLPFKDISDARWAEEAITYLYKNEIISGVSEDMFEPQRSVTREEFVKILLGILGIKPQKSAELIFADSSPEAWYNDYISTAKEMGIINGVSENEFGVGQFIRRQDMALMLYNGIKDKIRTDAEKINVYFNDEADINEYALSAVKALSTAGLFEGNENGCFLPHKSAARAEAAKVLYEAALLMKNTGD